MQATHLPARNPAAEAIFVSGRSWRLLYLITVAFGILIQWLAPHPPLTDMPQHAAQVALLRDILLGQSPWANLFHVNWLTPYIIGYGLALPLSFLMPIATVFKLMLSVAYAAFVWLCILLRRHFGADARMDWLFLLPFFGFAYEWGFLTFLVAAPIGLWFILLADRYAQAATLKRGVGLSLVGLLLLASHGLVFAFAVAVGGLLLLARAGWRRTFGMRILPYVVLAIFCGIYFFISRQMQAGIQCEVCSQFIWSGGITRFPKMLVYALGVDTGGIEGKVFLPATLVMIALPWLLGLRINTGSKPSWIPFATVTAIMLFVPTFALVTQFLYQRFGLFLLPAYAWMFVGPPKTATSPAMRTLSRLAIPLTVVCILASLLVHAAKAWNFRQQTAEIDAQIMRLEPRQRALILMYDPRFSPSDKAKTYGHYPAWYQAERQGLVDFNFAWFPPQIVRYRPEHLPVVAPGFEWHPERFEWNKYHGENYHYFFVRHASTEPADIFKGAPCAPVSIFKGGSWEIFERKACNAG
ncbi:MAG TPA: hypothetical protein VFS17_10260 [Methylophilaceae bacterium]|nr:hypothetical protein [Methylophilaceae bacterium]